MNIINILSIDNTFFTIIGYQMSYIEFFGTILNIWSVYLVSKNRVLNWPVGVVASILFLSLFWQIRLYSDFFEQIYYIATGIWGWIAWTVGRGVVGSSRNNVTVFNNTTRVIYVVVIAIMTLGLGYLMSALTYIYPSIFPDPASYPYLDAFTTVLSFAATYMLIARKLEAWCIWILVDIIGIWLYFVKDVKFLSLLYLVFLFLAIKGLINWWMISNNKIQEYEK